MTSRPGSKYFNRDLSWLSFNERVLQEAKDRENPLYERIKFFAIFSSNLDEFYRVRVASLRAVSNLRIKDEKKIEETRRLLRKILKKVVKLQEEFGKEFREVIIPGLNEQGIFIESADTLTDDDYLYLLEKYSPFMAQNVKPQIMQAGGIKTFLVNKALYLFSSLVRRGGSPDQARRKFVLTEIPGTLPRFIELPSGMDKFRYIMSDDLVRSFISEFFPAYTVEGSWSVKMTRDAELYIDDEFTGNLAEKIKKALAKRGTGEPARLLYDKTLPQPYAKFLRKSLRLRKDDLVEGGRYHNFMDFFSFPNPRSPELENPADQKISIPGIDNAADIFEALQKEDFLLYYPYNSFDYTIRLLTEAAVNPAIKKISVTLYRVANRSHVINALAEAAANGKEVNAFVEVKARFDEESNFSSASLLERYGVKVYYSIPGIKVHSKLCLIEGEKDNAPYNFTYLATGNFNEKTAGIYTDFALMTADKKMAVEAKRVFRYLFDGTKPVSFEKLCVSPFSLQTSLIGLINDEIARAAKGEDTEIILKLNGLEEKKLIKQLYKASQAGVKIKLIIRGICCLIPGVRGLSENIEVISILDKYLEHARVYFFRAGGEEKVYLSSADIMNRNIYRRVEVAFPVENENIRRLIIAIIRQQLDDNVKARIINQKQTNEYAAGNGAIKVRSQTEVVNLLKSYYGL